METSRRINNGMGEDENNGIKIANEIWEISQTQYSAFEKQLNLFNMTFKNQQLENAFLHYFDQVCHNNHYHLVEILIIEIVTGILTLLYLCFNFNQVPNILYILFPIFKLLAIILELLNIFHHKAEILNLISNYTLFLAISIGDFSAIVTHILFDLSFLNGLSEFLSMTAGMQFFLAMYCRSKTFFSTVISFGISFVFFFLTLNYNTIIEPNYKLVQLGGCIALTIAGSIYIYSRNKGSRKEFFDLFNLNKELRKQKEIQDNLPIPLIIANEEKITYFNNKTQNLFSIPRNSKADSTIKNIKYSLVGKCTSLSLIKLLKKPAQTPSKKNIKLNLGDTIFHMEVMKIPIIYDNQNNNFIVFKDITDAFMREKEKMQKGYELLIIGAMTHNFRTPLNCILGTSDLALQTYSNMPEKLRESLERINNQSNILFDFIDTIHEYFYFKSNKLSLNDSQFDPREIVKSVVKFYINEITEKRLEISLILPPETLLLFINDIKKYRLIIGSLLSNSIKFTFQGSITIGLTYNSTSGILCTYIEDTGVGISPDKLKKILKGISKLDDQDFNDMENVGLGIGIPLANAFCEIMDKTKLEIYTHENQGTKIQFNISNHFDSFINSQNMKTNSENESLIIEAKKDGPKLDQQNEEIKSTELLKFKQKILIVDDAESNIYILTQYAEKEGIEFACAHNGEEALNIYKESFGEHSLFRFFIVFMDINMPIMDGIESTRKIREFEKNFQVIVPIIGVTANFEVSIKSECKAAGMTSVKMKPFSFAQFQELITRYQS